MTPQTLTRSPCAQDASFEDDAVLLAALAIVVCSSVLLGSLTTYFLAAVEPKPYPRAPRVGVECSQMSTLGTHLATLNNDDLNSVHSAAVRRPTPSAFQGVPGAFTHMTWSSHALRAHFVDFAVHFASSISLASESMR